ncbi:VOC family protein [Leptospira johnsonii]|uniref:3-demethylubiquinone-9 3-methyltransferase domain protein n=1 Tax=Leptospira johnsonii TaxID=1917820 RepID=A0A2P2CZQ7_9LEPT|nr:VOC family protein [Leptospira johnsonii]GBF37883.1 3-demethylubiquinone-9 3-methyltransferase domain protein [Leptospira johnsonii]
MQKATPFLMFDKGLEEALQFYSGIFKNMKIEKLTKLGGGMVSASFVIEGQKFLAFTGGPHFQFSEAFSIYISAETQEEIDNLYEKLSAGGIKQPCGWVKDKFGLSWQIIPPLLEKYLYDKDQEKAQRVMQAMLQMYKIEISKLQEAYDKN